MRILWYVYGANICISNTSRGVMVVLYNYGNETQTIAAGERIVQGIFTKYFLIDNDDTTDQRTGGTGSTNK